MIDCAIIGASGYAARELLRILLAHPEARPALATSRREDEPPLADLHPSLRGKTDLACTLYSADRAASAASVAFLALPHAESMKVAPELLARGMKVIDLSADYRLKDAAVYQQWYQHAHADAAGLAEAVYGLPELYREAIAQARLIANPGCYTSASILGLAPSLAAGAVDPGSIIIDAKSGVSGAGREPKPNLHFPECNESLSAYGVGNHRHTPEIDQVLSDISGEKVEVIFTPHLVPMDRGICATIYAQPARGVAEPELMDMYRDFYRSSPFVRVVKHIPATKDAVGTNFCDITVRIVRGRILVISCLDNLIKGAAGAAIQNLNVISGFPEELGL